MANELGAAPQGHAPRGWDQLPRGLIQRFFQRLGPIDYLNAAQACLRWFGAAMEDHAATQLPLLLFLPNNPEGAVRFHSLADGYQYETLADELNSSICRGASYGWLLFEETSGIICVFHMLSGHQFYLPTHKTRAMPPLPHLVNCTPAQRRSQYPALTIAVLSSVPSDPRSAFAGVVGKKRLVMCWLADTTWVFVAESDSDTGYVDLAYHCGCFYALDGNNNLTVFDAAPNPNVRRIVAGASSAGCGPPAVFKYLVESLGELLLVENTLDRRTGAELVSGTSSYARIFKLDKHSPRWNPVLVDVEWSCSDALPAETEDENSRRTDPEGAGDGYSDGGPMPVEVEIDHTVRRRLLVLGRGTSRSLASEGFPDVTLEPFNCQLVYTLSFGQTTLIVSKRGLDRSIPPIWVTPNPRP